MRSVLAFTLFAFAVAAQGQAAMPAAPPSPAAPQVQQQAQIAPSATGSVTGHVYCGDTRRPARLARVSLRMVPSTDSVNRVTGFVGGSLSGVTDLDGSFHLYNVRPGRYYVDASLPGYVSPLKSVDPHDLIDTSAAAQDRVRSKVQIVEVMDNDSANADVTLERGAAISGTVKFDDGAVASNVYVLAVPVAQAQGAGPHPTGVASADILRERLLTGVSAGAQTDDRGHFRVAGLPAQTYLLMATLNLPTSAKPVPFSNSHGGVYYTTQRRIVNVYAPASLRKSGAMQFALTLGQERSDAEITLPLSGLHRVSGHVADSIKANEQGRRYVHLADKEDALFTRTASVTADGEFILEDVPNGNYVVSVSGASLGVAVHDGDVRDVMLSPPAEQ